MEHLTKQQIVLLTLLVSFMTSLSTGIVTVSLMDQAPAGVTRTINQVIEKTIQEAAPAQTASIGVVSINVDDELASSTAAVASSTVKIRSLTTGSVVGLGLIVSKEGSIVAPRVLIDQNQSYQAILADGTSVPLSLARMDDRLAFLSPASGLPGGSLSLFSPAQISGSYALGEKVFSLGGTSTPLLGDGLVTEAGSTSIGTSISSSRGTAGAPLFDILGNVIGIGEAPMGGAAEAAFYPLAPYMASSSVL